MSAARPLCPALRTKAEASVGACLGQKLDNTSIAARYSPRQTRLAARLIISATTATLKKNATIACNVTRRRNSLELMLTSEVCEAAPIDVEK